MFGVLPRCLRVCHPSRYFVTSCLYDLSLYQNLVLCLRACGSLGTSPSCWSLISSFKKSWIQALIELAKLQGLSYTNLCQIVNLEIPSTLLEVCKYMSLTHVTRSGCHPQGPWCHAWNQKGARFGVNSQSGNAIRPYLPFQKLSLYLTYCDQIRHLEGCDITQSHDY